eukprot:TRINITY_DN16701_c0_g1_i1.p1 TRINITY_DN16701_c0_g1~~TRINITY_DN16701_c0_g1_i1.p1  ORF type:complete len:184 (-),score=13.21 TRINITY_DN16701_c0_g1_i1:156-707(-)
MEYKVNKSNAITDIILTISCILPILNIPVRENFYISYAFGFISISLASFFGVLYFSGLQQVKASHQLFIQISTTMGVGGISFGKIMSIYYPSISSESTFFIMVLLIFSTFITGKNLTIAYLSILGIAWYCIVRRDLLTFIALIIFLTSVLLKEKKVGLLNLDDVDLFHLILSLSIYLFYKSIN